MVGCREEVRCGIRFMHVYNTVPVTLVTIYVIVFTVSLADISPGRKGNGGESIYGPTFEGTFIRTEKKCSTQICTL